MTTSDSNRLPTPLLLKASGAAILAAVAANIIVRLVIGMLIPLSPDFLPFDMSSIVIFTFFFALIGAGVLAIVNRFARNPLKVFNIIAIVGFIIASLPNLAGAANPAVMPMGGSGADYLILLLFHFVAIGAYLGVLNYVARKG